MAPWKIYWGFSELPNHTRRRRTTLKSSTPKWNWTTTRAREIIIRRKLHHWYRNYRGRIGIRKYFKNKWKCGRHLGDFNDKLVPSNYYSFLNDDDDDVNNIPGTPVDNSLPENEGGEYDVITYDEDINDEIIIDNDERLASDIDPHQNKIL